MNILEARGLSAGYDEGFVLRDVDLAVGAGEFVAILGRNGSGKSTLIKAAQSPANLTDGIWRFASADQLASVKYTITHGVNDASNAQTRNAVMPAFGNRLSSTDIKKLAVYVHKLGGGQQMAAAEPVAVETTPAEGAAPATP